MPDAFVWFHNGTKKPAESVSFYEQLLGWKPASGPDGMTLFAGAKGPFAAVGDEQGIGGWIPYAQVTDLAAATQKATKLGAKVIQSQKRGPAGDFTVLRDPGGATLALWQKL